MLGSHDRLLPVIHPRSRNCLRNCKDRRHAVSFLALGWLFLTQAQTFQATKIRGSQAFGIVLGIARSIVAAVSGRVSAGKGWFCRKLTESPSLSARPSS